MKGQLRKMSHEPLDPVRYYLNLGDETAPLTPEVGKTATVRFLGKITCIECGRKIGKTYNQGYCYPCFRDLPQNALCGVRPERCEHERGNERDREFFRTRCNADHFVYLALTSGVKVGVTRYSNIPSRWIDQGAVKALIIARVPQRILAGKIEVALAEKMPDKTNWRKMLSGNIDDADLLKARGQAVEWFPPELREYALEDEKIQTFAYPIQSPPQKIASHNLDKTPEFADILTGIKGQYLIFGNRVINLRKYAGYHMEFSFAEK